LRHDRLEVTYVGIEPELLGFADGRSLKHAEHCSPHDNEQCAVESSGVTHVASHVDRISPERNEEGLVFFK
jgi:hypothetical protein